MGEDTGEIIEKLVKYFDIKFADDERLTEPITVGAIQDLTWKYVYNKRTEGCMSQSLYYKMRQLLNKSLHLQPGTFIPSAFMAQIVPLDNRRKVYYKQLESESSYKFPRLVLNKKWTLINNIIGWSIFLGALAYTFYHIQILGESTWWLLMIIASFLLIGLVKKVFEPLRNSFDDMTVDTFIKKMLLINPQLITEKGITRQEADWLVVNTISELAGIDLEEITPEKRFLDDLGIN